MSTSHLASHDHHILTNSLAALGSAISSQRPSLNLVGSLELTATCILEMLMGELDLLVVPRREQAHLTRNYKNYLASARIVLALSIIPHSLRAALAP